MKEVGYNRMRYLLEALDDLDKQFKKCGGRLIMIKGQPNVVFRRLWEEFGKLQYSIFNRFGFKSLQRVSHAALKGSVI